MLAQSAAERERQQDREGEEEPGGERPDSGLSERFLARLARGRLLAPAPPLVQPQQQQRGEKAEPERDGDMRQRWCVAGLLDAERHFNRVKGYRHLKQLLNALQHDLDGPTLDAQRKPA